MNNSIRISVLLCCFGLSFYAHSTATHNAWYVGEAIGVSLPGISNDTYVPTGSGWPEDRYHTQSVAAVADFSILGGYRWAREPSWLPFFSLSARYTNAVPAQVRGAIVQYNLPQFENYQYHYKVQRQTLLGIAKATVYNYHQFMPFITAGLGVSANRIKDYSETPLPGIIRRTTPGFQNNTSHTLSSMIGAGIDYSLTDYLWMGIEYTYGYYGKPRSGAGIYGFASEYLQVRYTDSSVAYSIHYFFEKAA